MSGLVSFVGAGPGAVDLLTVRATRRLAQADVVVWASSLVSEEALELAPATAARFDSATMTLEDVLAVYAAHPDARVVRLHSGDPALYGAVQEQVDWCEATGRPYELVPGVSSLAAAAAVVGRELTIPGVSQTVVVTRLPARTTASMPDAEALAAYAATGCSLAVFLSGARPEALEQALLEPPSAYRPDTPAAVVVRASWPDQQVHRCQLAELAATMRATGTTLTVLVLVGEFLRADPGRSHLYSPAFAHTFRKRSLPGSTAGRPATSRGTRRQAAEPRRS